MTALPTASPVIKANIDQKTININFIGPKLSSPTTQHLNLDEVSRIRSFPTVAEARKLEESQKEVGMPIRMFLQGTIKWTVSSALLLALAITCHGQSKPAIETVPHKDPKLSALIAQLRAAIPQGSQASAAVELPEMKESSTQLPAEVNAALHSRILRADKAGNIQVDILIDNTYPGWRAELASVGFQLQVAGNPNPNKAAGEVRFAAPVAEGLLAPTAIDRVASLAFVRYIGLPSYGVSNSGSVDSQGDHILQADLALSTLNLDGTGVRVGVISSGIAGIFGSGCTTNCTATTAVPSPMTLGDLPTAVGTRNAAGTLISVSGGITAIKSYRTDGDLEAIADGSEGGEGTAMLEIVHDLAARATLFFTNAETSLQFEQAVDALAFTTDVVVDDLTWFTPPFDGTSAVSQNTSDALNNNAYPIRAYFTAAGNWAQDHYQGIFTDSTQDGTPYTGEAGDLHTFQGTTGVLVPDLDPAPGITTDNGGFGPVPFDPLIAIPPGQSVSVHLAWNDPELASTNDYDLFLVPLSCNGIANLQPVKKCNLIPGAAPLGKGVDPQTGIQNPAEQLSWTNNTGSTQTVGIVIENVGNMAKAVTFDLFVDGYYAKTSTQTHNFNTVTGSIAAQNDAGGGVVTVGAINQSQCTIPEICVGLLEAYSSQGPTELTPQSTTGTMKPDVVAVDQVCVTGAGGFRSVDPATNCPPAQPTTYTPVSFGGTSAAAPHSAAAAALALEAAPCLLEANMTAIGTPSSARSKLRAALVGTTILPTGANMTPTYIVGASHPLPGYFESVPNSIEGWGLVDAYDTALSMVPTTSALSTTATGITPIIVPAISNAGASVVITPSASDPNGCPVVSIEWSGACGGPASTQGTHTTLQCPIGINTVQVAASNNGHTYQPLSGVPNSTIIVTDFVLAAVPTVPPTVNVQPGATLLYTVTAQSTAQGQFANPITLACTSGLPANATCAFSPTTINATNSTGTTTVSPNSTLTIYTSGTAQLTPTPFTKHTGKPSIWLATCLLPWLFVSRAWRRTRIANVLLAAIVAAAMLMAIQGCGSQTAATVPTTYTVTITGTANQLQHSTTISFAVQ